MIGSIKTMVSESVAIVELQKHEIFFGWCPAQQSPSSQQQMKVNPTFPKKRISKAAVTKKITCLFISFKYPKDRRIYCQSPRCQSSLNSSWFEDYLLRQIFPLSEIPQAYLFSLSSVFIKAFARVGICRFRWKMRLNCRSNPEARIRRPISCRCWISHRTV